MWCYYSETSILIFSGFLPGSSAASIKPGWKCRFTTSGTSYLPPFTTPAIYLPEEPVPTTNAPDRTVNGTNSTCHQDIGVNILHSFQDVRQWVNPATFLFLMAFLVQIILVARCCLRSNIKAQLNRTEDAYRSSMESYKKSQDDLKIAHDEMIDLLKDPEKTELMRSWANNRKKISGPPFCQQPLRPPTLRNQNFKQSTKKPSLEDRNGQEAIPIGFQNIPLNTLDLKKEVKNALPAHLEEDEDLPPFPATSEDGYEIPCCQFPSQTWPVSTTRPLPPPPPQKWPEGVKKRNFFPDKSIFQNSAIGTLLLIKINFF